MGRNKAQQDTRERALTRTSGIPISGKTRRSLRPDCDYGFVIHDEIRLASCPVNEIKCFLSSRYTYVRATVASATISAREKSQSESRSFGDDAIIVYDYL